MLHQIPRSVHHALVTGIVVATVALGSSGDLEAAQLAPTPTPAPVNTPASGERGLSPGFGNVGSLSPGFANVGSVGGSTTTAVAQLRPRTSALTAEGEATLLRSGEDTVVTVNLSNLIPGAVYAGRIQAGSCDGPVLFNLESVAVDTQGRGRASSLVPEPIDSSSWWIAYQTTGDASASESTCGQVQAD